MGFDHEPPNPGKFLLYIFTTLLTFDLRRLVIFNKLHAAEHLQASRLMSPKQVNPPCSCWCISDLFIHSPMPERYTKACLKHRWLDD
jgi:hypothetical protein